ncbi:chromosome segregation protein SMC [Deefgea piscis]|uniref:Chromosome partition protein Smc n=1 Tax=Deefgea piscis TaxID=2739061 RepID=A0A6M8SWD9_9NEIS|nr:chromosome segregation protein SMC [Deefgea piscis]QKJ67906.1 chromosome segregation protein SMC [Deefgea piscis]
MRLTHIKLSGFKSFVDPTAIPVPGQLVAVCGPNGCGKSNVIDAVRWVLGESSAKQLRGESMQDVIFNGSTTRKAVSRAAVELVFDNSAGLLTGAWQAYAEISIKRVLTRQGDSSYFINQQAVRRRDITELFMGTGVGKSGYAIIEQGMINRIIEAKPDELRQYLEEAAGVSKYKERRRETESRIADTRDNLARVADIQLELQRQIDTLSRQAGVAQQYQTLSQQITQAEQLQALQRKLDAAVAADAAHMALLQAQTQLEAAVAQVTAAETQLEYLRESHFIASDVLQAAQADLYAANAEVARIEQTLLHLKQSRERLAQQIAQCEQDEQAQQQSLSDIQLALEQCHDQQDDLQLAVEAANMALAEASLSLPDQEQERHYAEQAWQTLKEQLAAQHSAQQLQLQERQFVQRQIGQLHSQQQQLQAELNQLAPVALTEDLPEQIDDYRYELAELELTLAAHAESRLVLDAQLAQQLSAAQQLQDEVTQLAAREQALREVLTVTTSAALSPWLAHSQLQDAPQLSELLRVAAGWELAVEAVLGQKMQGILGRVDSAPPSALFVLSPAPVTGPVHPQSLWQHVAQSDARLHAGLQALLGTVLCVEHTAQLWTQQSEIPEGYSWVSIDGHIATRYTLDFFAGQSADAGRLARQAELRKVSAALEVAQLAQQNHAPLLASTQLEHAALLQAQQQSQAQYAQRAQTLPALENEWRRQQEQQAQRQSRLEAVQQTLAQVSQQLTEENAHSVALDTELERLATSLLQLQTQEQQARASKEGFQASQSQHSLQLRELERSAQSAQFAVVNQAQQIRGLQQRQNDLNQLREQQSQRKQALEQEAQTIQIDEIDAQFQVLLARRAEQEQVLTQAKEALNQCATTLREQELNKQNAEKAAATQRDALGQMRLAEQETRLNLARYADEMQTLAVDEAALQPLLGRSVKAYAAEISRLNGQLSQLGPVNLAAMQELAANEERQSYLAEQSRDLEQAMATLSAAITRIDKETRSLLQSTYDSVNANLQELFPALFGGGHAELTLTGGEILDSGMSLMAQPPGKKNATIHLLSGGEKALTALSLVFSLFKLNPAPFCLLDEVDAPLDDANTLRFCELVKKMAQHTQFLYISHNKLTMEMAQQLVGVTMQEQGVSRIVAVDIEAALKMREPEFN